MPRAEEPHPFDFQRKLSAGGDDSQQREARWAQDKAALEARLAEAALFQSPE